MPQIPPEAMRFGKLVLRVVGFGMFLFGAVFLLVGSWFGHDYYKVSKRWMPVDAEVVRSSVWEDPMRDSEGERIYQAEVEFRYIVGGQEYITSARSFIASKNRGQMEAKVRDYPPGSRRQIRFDPQNPGRISFDAEGDTGAVVLVVIFGGVGLLFTSLGLVMIVKFRSKRTVQCTSCGQFATAGQRFCPNCAAPLPIA